MTTDTQVADIVSNVPPPSQVAFTADDIEHLGIPAKDTMIHPDDLMVDETLAVRRTKITEAKVEEMAKSIVANGQLSAILVRRHPTEKGKYFIVAGETRVRAVEYANNKLTASTLDSLVTPLLVAAKVVDMSDLAAFTAGAIENLKRNDMGPVDMANIVGMYKNKFGMTNLEISRALGKTMSWVGEHLLILTSPPATRRRLPSVKSPIPWSGI